MGGLDDDLRAILSQNIKNARESLHLTQSGLAESARISLSYIVDIERRRTWVSDKTLVSIAGALNMRPFELLMPAEGSRAGEGGVALLPRITDIIGTKKSELKDSSDKVMGDLARDIIKLFADL
jgi:transcriptional regulator with XRE-family HTH domain